MKLTNTLDLRNAFDRREFVFGGSGASPTTVCLIGSCRVLPLLNYLRAYNEVNGDSVRVICYNPVEMWQPGGSVEDGVATCLAGHRIGQVQYLVCEHLENCGMLNTADGTENNVFADLGCEPGTVLRLPNWHAMFIYDDELSDLDKSYGALDGAERVGRLRDTIAEHKQRFLSHCELPGLRQWVEDEWQTTRIGWTSNHVTRAFSWRVFGILGALMGLTLDDRLAAHPACTSDIFAGQHTTLNPTDYEAGGWRF